MIARYCLLLFLMLQSSFLRAQPGWELGIGDVGPIEYLTPGTHNFTIGGYGPMMFEPYQAGWSFNGGPWEVHNATPTLVGVMNRFKVGLPVTPSITVTTPGQYTFRAFISCPTCPGPDYSNDTITKIVRVHNSLPPKNVLLEVLKFQGCPPCWSGDTAVNGQMLPRPYMNVARLYIAPGEPLYNASADTVDAEVDQLPGHPSYMYDRFRFPYRTGQAVNVVEQNGTKWLADSGSRVKYLEPLSVSFDAVSLDTVTRSLNVTLSTTIFDTLNGDYRFNLFVTEDSIYSWQDGSPTGMSWHQRVLRIPAGGSWGTAGSLPALLLPGQTLTHNYQLTIPAAYKLKQLRLIGFVQHLSATDTANFKVLNSVGGRLLTLVQTTGVTDLKDAGLLQLYPNPVIDRLKISWTEVSKLRFRISDLSGRTLREWFDEGQAFSVSMEDLPAGNYLLSATDGAVSKAAQFVKQ